MPPKKTKAPTDTRSEYDKQLDAARGRMSYDGVPPPNYPFKIGDSVLYGNLCDVRIEGFEREDGGVLHLSYSDKGESYGKPFDNGRRLPVIAAWTDISVDFGDSPPAPMFDIEESWKSPSFFNSQLEGLVSRVYRYGVIDTPDYQRGYVWGPADREHLLDSILDRRDIGKFVYAIDGTYNDPRIEIIDGKQRLRTLMDFMENRFSYRGRRWFDLHRRDQRHIRSYNIQSAELRKPQWTRVDILRTFLTINAASVPRTEAHLAHVRALLQAELEKAK